MKTLQAYLITALALVLIAGCNSGDNPATSHETVTVDGGSLAKGNATVTGGGTALEGNPGSEVRSTFSFNAIKRSNGTVTGKLVYHFRLGEITIWMDINCLSIAGNTATLGGIVTRSVPPSSAVGMEFVFKVQDSGEGSGASPDLFSDVDFGTCQAHPSLPLYIVMNGNIQVKP